MKDSKNITIALLLVSAAVLATIIGFSDLFTPEPAYADGSTRDGDYTMVTGAWSPDIDLLYVIDIRARKLGVYVPNIQTSTIEFKHGVDLARLFGNQ